MIEFSMRKANENFLAISDLLETKKEDCVIITKNGKPKLKIVLVQEGSRENLIGCAKGLFDIPEDFDDIDIFAD